MSGAPLQVFAIILDDTFSTTLSPATAMDRAPPVSQPGQYSLVRQKSSCYRSQHKAMSESSTFQPRHRRQRPKRHVPLTVLILVHYWSFVSTTTAFTVKSTSSSSLTLFRMAGLFGEQEWSSNNSGNKGAGSLSPLPTSAEWQIYIDQSKASLDRGGGATLDAFCCLAPTSSVAVVPCILPKSSSSSNNSNKAPWVRCISKLPGRSNLDIGNVDSVDKVYRVLTKHLRVKNVNSQIRESLKWKYKGNSLLEKDDTRGAIASYNQALHLLGYSSSPSSSSSSLSSSPSTKRLSTGGTAKDKQGGVILLLRSSAYLQQAQKHKELLQKTVDDWSQPNSADMQAMMRVSTIGTGATVVGSATQPTDGEGDRKSIGDGTSGNHDITPKGVNIQQNDSEINSLQSVGGQSTIGLAFMKKLHKNGSVQKTRLRRIQFLHGLYQNSLLQAAQDSLRATELLPDYSTSWLRAAELLSDLWKINDSRQYFEKAVTLDGDLQDAMVPILKGLDRREDLLQRARSMRDWPEDSVRLALDVSA